MYNPKHFAIDDIAELHSMIERHSFGILVTQHEGAPFATHLPFLLDPTRGPYGTLLAHMARANPQWRSLEGGEPPLAIFQGPHAYISPAWYATAPSVPTWNYTAVHAYGAARIVSDPAELLAMLGRLVDTSEAGFTQPWRMRSQPAEYLERMLGGIVGFEIEITRLEGKHKLSQNRSAADRAGVVAALRTSADPASAAVGELMG